MSQVPLSRQALLTLVDELQGIFGARFRSLVAYGAQAGSEPGADDAGTAYPAGELRGEADRSDPGVDPSGHRVDALLDRGGTLHTMAVVSDIAFTDLAACALRLTEWTGRGFATPLLITEREFARSLDAFPLEYGDIIAQHVVVAGRDPFEGLKVKPEDLRRACEVQAKSHLLHLREGYIQTGGRPSRIADLVAASSAPFATLLRNIARLQHVKARTPDELARHAESAMGVPADVISQVVAIRRPEDLSSIDAVRLYPAYLEAVERLASFVDQWVL
jgi:hypothetical protein